MLWRRWQAWRSERVQERQFENPAPEGAARAGFSGPLVRAVGYQVSRRAVISWSLLIDERPSMSSSRARW